MIVRMYRGQHWRIHTLSSQHCFLLQFHAPLRAQIGEHQPPPREMSQGKELDQHRPAAQTADNVPNAAALAMECQYAFPQLLKIGDFSATSLAGFSRTRALPGKSMFIGSATIRFNDAMICEMS